VSSAPSIVSGATAIVDGGLRVGDASGERRRERGERGERGERAAHRQASVAQSTIVGRDAA
jgi:hypothetical protein